MAGLGFAPLELLSLLYGPKYCEDQDQTSTSYILKFIVFSLQENDEYGKCKYLN